jgi:hypothetical protein
LFSTTVAVFVIIITIVTIPRRLLHSFLKISF